MPRSRPTPRGDAEARKWVVALLGNAPADEQLLRFLVGAAGGVPARLVDWLHLLASCTRSRPGHHSSRSSEYLRGAPP
jgi:hypothetical protein